MNSLFSFLSLIHFGSFVKVTFLIMLFLYVIFALIIQNQVRSLNKLVTIENGHSSYVLRAFAILYVLLAISLFLVSIVIL